MATASVSEPRPPERQPGSSTTARLVRQTLRLRRRRRAQRIWLGIGFPLVVLAIWETLVWFGVVDRRFFPPPSRIVATAVAFFSDATARVGLAHDLTATLARLGTGYVLGALSGVVIGILMALYAPIRFALGPIVYATYPTPKLAIFPLLIVIFGLGDASKTSLVTLGVFYMTCINSLSGVLYANPVYRDLAQAFCMPAWTRWTRVVVPSALPAIVTGLKLGIGQALILVVSAEFVAADDGIGHFIWNSWQVLDISRMFVGLFVVAVIGGIVVTLGDVVERKLIPWTTT